MVSSFTSIVTYYFDLISDFLLSDPIKYFTGAFLLLVIIKILSSLFKSY